MLKRVMTQTVLCLLLLLFVCGCGSTDIPGAAQQGSEPSGAGNNTVAATPTPMAVAIPEAETAEEAYEKYAMFSQMMGVSSENDRESISFDVDVKVDVITEVSKYNTVVLPTKTRGNIKATVEDGITTFEAVLTTESSVLGSVSTSTTKMSYDGARAHYEVDGKAVNITEEEIVTELNQTAEVPDITLDAIKRFNIKSEEDKETILITVDGNEIADYALRATEAELGDDTEVSFNDVDMVYVIKNDGTPISYDMTMVMYISTGDIGGKVTLRVEYSFNSYSSTIMSDV